MKILGQMKVQWEGVMPAVTTKFTKEDTSGSRYVPSKY